MPTETLQAPLKETTGKKRAQEEQKDVRPPAQVRIVQAILDDMARRNGMVNGIDPVTYEKMREHWQDLVAKELAEPQAEKK